MWTWLNRNKISRGPDKFTVWQSNTTMTETQHQSTLTTLIRCPMAFAGRLLVNFALTMPLLPWARVTFPQITRVLLGLPPGVTVFLQTTQPRWAWLLQQLFTCRGLDDCVHSKTRNMLYFFIVKVKQSLAKPLNQNKKICLQFSVWIW